MKRLVSFLCVILAIALLCGIPSASAAGIKNKYATTAGAAFAEYMEKEDYIVTYEGVQTTDDGKKEDLFSLVFECDNVDSLEIFVWFDYDNEGASFFIWDYVVGTAKQVNKLITICNQENLDYRYAKFYVEDDYTVTVAGDVVFRDNDIGELCEEMMYHVLNIADMCYEDFR